MTNVIVLGDYLPQLVDSINSYGIKCVKETMLIDEDDIIILVNQPPKIIKEYDELDNKMIIVSIKGNSGFIFVNVGEDYLVKNSHINKTVQIGSINNNICSCPPNYKHNLNNNDIIMFINVEGECYNNLNNIEFKIEVISPTSFKLLGSIICTDGFKNATAVLVSKSNFISHKKFMHFKNNIENESKYDFVFQPILNIFTSVVTSQVINILFNSYKPISQFWHWKDDLITTNTLNNNYNILVETNNNMKVNSILEKIFVVDSLKKYDAIIEISDNNKRKNELNEYSFQNDIPLFSGMLESTETFSVIPYLTDTLFNMYKIKEKQTYPICVIKSFPINIEQCIEWVDEHFENNIVMQNSESIQTYEECVYKAIGMFNEFYINNINAILLLFPPSHTTEQGLYWSNGKRQPNIIPLNLDYIKITSQIIANSYFIETKEELLHEIIKQYNENEDIKTNSCIASSKMNSQFSIGKMNSQFSIGKMNSQFSIGKTYNFKLSKNNNSDYIIANYIKIASELRASNYNIPIIYNKINQNMLSLTEDIMVNITIIEMFKYLLSKNKIIDKKDYYSTSIDNTNNIIVYTKEKQPDEYNIGKYTFNKWTKFRYNEDSTIAEFKEFYNKMFNVDITMIVNDTTILYSDVIESSNLDKKISSIIKNNINLKKDSILLSMACDDDTIELPDIYFSL